MGVCVRIKGDVWVVVVVFKGNDPHTGTSPSVTDKGKMHEIYCILRDLWDGVPSPNRCGFVIYQQWAATTRAASMSISPSLTFMNQGGYTPHKDSYLNYIQHGAKSKLLGNFEGFFNRLHREGVFHQWNYQQHLEGNSFDVTTTLPQMTYIDEDGATKHCDPVPFHPIKHALYVREMRGRFQWLNDVAYLYTLPITKAAMRKAQQKMLSAGESSENDAPAGLLMPNERPSFYTSYFSQEANYQGEQDNLAPSSSPSNGTNHASGSRILEGAVTVSENSMPIDNDGTRETNHPKDSRGTTTDKAKGKRKYVSDDEEDSEEDEEQPSDEQESDGSEYEIEEVLDSQKSKVIWFHNLTVSC